MLIRRHSQKALVAILLFVSVSAASAFDEPVVYEVGASAMGVTIGDIDGDGLADVAVANADVSLLFNEGSGLGPEQRIDPGTGGARQVVIEDIDADGDRDLVVLLRDGDSAIGVLRNQGDGTFAFPEPHGAPSFAFALRLADIDRDGDPDVLIGEGLLQASIRLLRNDGSGSFEFAGSHLLAPSQIGIVYVADMDVADFNGDGYPDAVGCSDNSGVVELLFNDGAGALLPPVPVELGQQFPTGVLTRDVNRDGRPDLLVMSCGTPAELRVGLNDGAGGFVLTDVEPLDGACHSFTNPTGLASGYLDDDTTLDLAYPSWLTASVRLLHGVGDGTFTASETLPTTAQPIVVATGSLNGDGSHDVVSGNFLSSTIEVTTNAQCAPLLDQTVLAAASGVDYFWPTSLPYLAARGTFAAAEDVGAFEVDVQFSADGNALHDAESPAAGSGFWYLVRPDCVGASWTSTGAAELPGRDAALP